jgi:hypothetical protein
MPFLRAGVEYGMSDGKHNDHVKKQLKRTDGRIDVLIRKLSKEIMRFGKNACKLNPETIL